MNTYSWLITLILLNIFTSSYSAIAQTLIEIKPYLLSQSYQEQETRINVNQNQLNFPYLLSLKTSSTNLQGKIEVNGKVITTKLNSNTVIDLSRYLNQGQNTVLITGSYSPANSSVTINLQGNGSNVTQTTGGNGQIKQKITVYVD
jgi:hypothetical protein